MRSPQTQAIEDLKIVVNQQTNVVLSWPSVSGETFIIEYRETLSPATPWASLTNGLPAASGTNRTTVTHIGIIPPAPSPQGGGGGGGGNPPSPMMLSSEEDLYASPEAFERVQLLRRMGTPPVPWDSRFVRSAELNDGFSPMNMEENGSGGSTVATGFYRVVRTGIHAFGITNSTLLSGRVLLNFELGATNSVPYSGLFAYTTNGPLPALNFLEPTNGFLQATWDTTHLTNGGYEVIWGAGMDHTLPSLLKTNTVTVANNIWLPEGGSEAAGDALRIMAQTVHTNGSWSLKIYDESNNLLSSSLSGPVDANGYVKLASQQGPGFSLSLLDGNGQPLPYTAYKMELTVNPPGPAPQNEGGSALLAYTNFVERPKWDGHTIFAIAYMPIYGSPSSGNVNALNLQAMIQNVYMVAENRGLGQQVIRGSSQAPFELNSSQEWGTLFIDLKQPLVRNLYYWGHGAPNYFGSAPTNQHIDWFSLTKHLNNLWGYPNQHAYRFVFLDGCLTATGNLPTAFAMLRLPLPLQWFQDRGLRERAFMGWSDYVLAGWAAFNQQHATFVSNFYVNWGGGATLLDARNQAAGPIGTSLRNNVEANLKIYGYENLLLQD